MRAVACFVKFVSCSASFAEKRVHFHYQSGLNVAVFSSAKDLTVYSSL